MDTTHIIVLAILINFGININLYVKLLNDTNYSKVYLYPIIIYNGLLIGILLRYFHG